MYGAATLGSVVAILLLTRDLEKVGAAVLGPLFTLPAIACYVLLVHTRYSKTTCNYVYWIMGLPLPLYWVYFSFLSTPGARSDSADDMAFLIAVCTLAAGVTAYVADQLWRRNTSGR
jgi:hypothetical protein